MNKPSAIILIAVAIIGFFVIGSPIEKSDTPQTVAKKYEENVRMDVAQDVGGRVINEVGTQAVNNNCKDPNSSFCSTTTFAMSVIGVVFAVLIIAGILAGIIAVIRVINSIIEQLT